jgi:threonine aldolase
MKRGFASDNNSGVHPLVLQAIQNANIDHTIAYGDDIYTEEAIKKIEEIFGNDVDVYFVFTGTAANVLGLTSITNSFNSIICAETAHINEDECGAPEKFSGCKVLSLETSDGKLTKDLIKKHLYGFGFEHHSQPAVISITQATEMGTVYRPEELKELCDFAHEQNLMVHMDGARIANAAAFLGCTFKEITTDVGVDVLSFGGTKNGLMYGEALIFFNKDLSKNFKYLRKQGMQLASKMRFIGAQFNALLTDDLWLRNAKHSNSMAKLLYEEIKDIPRIKVTQNVEANGIFALVPPEYIEKLKNEYFFYMWNEETSEVRWMTSFDTSKDDVKNFSELIKKIVV